MATFVEKIDKDSDYIKVIEVVKTFKDGEIFTMQNLIRRYMEYYQITDIEEATKVVGSEFKRVVTNLMQYSKLKKLANGQCRVCLKRNPREERIHTKKREKTIE